MDRDLQSELNFVKELLERAETDKKGEKDSRRKLEEELSVVRKQLEDLYTRSKSQRENRADVLAEEQLQRALKDKADLEIRLRHAAVKEESINARLDELARYPFPLLYTVSLYVLTQ